MQKSEILELCQKMPDMQEKIVQFKCFKQSEAFKHTLDTISKLQYML